MEGPFKRQSFQAGDRWRLDLTRSLVAAALLVTCGCGATVSDSPLPVSSPLQRPISPLDGTAASARADSFLRRRVGSEYYDAHFALASAERVGSILKASYLYTYRPYVANSSMTLFLDGEGVRLASDQVSLVLLEPQEFALDVQQAVTLAAERGLDETGEYQVELYFGGETGYRFAWRFVGPPDESVEASPGALMDVAIDVEDGRVHFCEVVGISQGHE